MRKLKGRKKPKVLLPKKMTRKSPVVKLPGKKRKSGNVLNHSSPRRSPTPHSEGLSEKENASPDQPEQIKPTGGGSNRKTFVRVMKSKSKPLPKNDRSFNAVLQFHKLKRELLPILFTRLMLSHPDASRELLQQIEESDTEE